MRRRLRARPIRSTSPTRRTARVPRETSGKAGKAVAIVAAVLPDADAASVTVTYEAKAKISSKISAYVPLEGGWEKVKILPYEFPAIGVGTYQVKLTANGVDTIVTMTLTDAEIADGYVLACSCHPQSDLVLA